MSPKYDDETTEIIQKCARKIALKNVDRWSCPNTVKQFLETGDKSLIFSARHLAWSLASHYAVIKQREASKAANLAVSAITMHQDFYPGVLIRMVEDLKCT